MVINHDHCDQHARTLIAVGYYAYGIYEYNHDHGLLDPLDNTAPETSVLQIPSNVRLETSRLGPKMEPDCPAQRNYRGSRGGRLQNRYCPNPRRQSSSAIESFPSPAGASPNRKYRLWAYTPAAGGFCGDGFLTAVGCGLANLVVEGM